MDRLGAESVEFRDLCTARSSCPGNSNRVWRCPIKKILWNVLVLALLASCVGDGLALSAAPKRPRARRVTCGITRIIDCPAEGCGGDAKLNVSKNREDIPTSVEDWTIGRILALDSDTPTTWKRGQNRDAVIALGEGTAIRVEAFLVHANVTGTPESTNCRLSGARDNDYHLLLVSRATDGKRKGVVVEITPRLRPAAWSIAKLRRLARDRKRVRVTGYLLFDSAHPQPSLSYRGTAWEIHPVTSFEVETSSGWVDLEIVE